MRSNEQTICQQYVQWTLFDYGAIREEIHILFIQDLILKEYIIEVTINIMLIDNDLDVCP